MASRYEKGSKETLAIVKALVKEFHKDLDTQDVKIDVIMAFAPENDGGEKVGCAVRLHGYQANALTGIVNLKNRVMGRGDAEIILDGDTWDSLADDNKKAILDHQLQFLAVRRNHKGEILVDTHGRPKLSMRKHDRQFGWFDAVAKRHGVNSVEVQQAKTIFDEAGQVYFGFLQPALPGIEEGGEK